MADGGPTWRSKREGVKRRLPRAWPSVSDGRGVLPDGWWELVAGSRELAAGFKNTHTAAGPCTVTAPATTSPPEQDERADTDKQ